MSEADEGKAISFNVFVFNSQPGIEINYIDGTSKLLTEQTAINAGEYGLNTENDADNQEYILNKNTKKIHLKDCQSVKDIKGKNKEAYTGRKEYMLNIGYTECDRCNP